MRTRSRLFLAALLCLFAVGIISGQQSQKSTDRPSPAPSVSKAVIDSWNEIGGKLIEMAEDFPEDKYDYKATPQQRTFAEVLLHVVGTSSGSRRQRHVRNGQNVFQ